MRQFQLRGTGLHGGPLQMLTVWRMELPAKTGRIAWPGCGIGSFSLRLIWQKRTGISCVVRSRMRLSDSRLDALRRETPLAEPEPQNALQLADMTVDDSSDGSSKGGVSRNAAAEWGNAPSEPSRRARVRRRRKSVPEQLASGKNADLRRLPRGSKFRQGAICV